MLMNGMYLLEQLINGICQGSIYALIAIGYTLICGVVGLVSLCYGDSVMFGAFVSYVAFGALGTNPVLAFLVSFGGTALLGALLHKTCCEPFLDSPRHISVMCTIGAGIFIKNVVQLLTKSETKPIPRIFGEGFFTIGEIHVSYVQVAVLAIVLFLIIVLSFFLNKTKVGISLKAVSQDRKAAELVGINVKATTLLGNMIGCGLGGIAGMLYAVYYASFQANFGGPIGIKAFSASVLGGMTDITVAATGGLTIGILENFGVALFGSGYRDLVAFLFLIIVLIFKPQGLSFKFKKRGAK